MRICKGLLFGFLVFVMVMPACLKADSPGMIVGYSTRDQQTVSGTNNRCALDSQGGAHFAWTQGGFSDRQVEYNFVDENGNLFFGDGTSVNSVDGAGFPSVTTTLDDAAVVAYHNFSHWDITLGIDAGRGLGIFTLYDPPNDIPGGDITFWPEMAIDSTGRYHILSIEHGMEEITVPMIYSRSGDTPDDWVGPTFVDTIAVQAYLVVGSKYTGKVAIVYAKPRQIADADYYNNDVVYIESPDGVNWDFENKVNITNYTMDDTVRCFNSLDAVYDPEGNLHIVWTTPFYDEYSREVTTDSCLLWHWSEATGANIITDGLNPSNGGAWQLSISNCNISVSDDGILYVTYSRFNDDDVSQAGFSNGDIYYTFSIDNGEFWFPDENLTESNTDGCIAGDCDNDMQVSTAQYVDYALHIFYIDDKDAGMSNSGEGEETNNPQVYLKHTVESGIIDGGMNNLPEGFYLAPPYPNPFNAETRIGYIVGKTSRVKLEVFNIAGQLINVLVDGNKKPGQYVATFDGTDLSSGIYFCKLTVGNGVSARRMTLLK